jgi:hypothetical protein
LRPIGFSTGALAKSDFERALEALRFHPEATAIELSALRDHELEPLVSAIERLDLPPYAYVSVHAPSKLRSLSEPRAIDLLMRFPEDWPIVAHPDILLTPARWQAFGPRLCIENMDNRKTDGRTATEMKDLFDRFPHASFCPDVGHARQIDPTTIE